MTTTVSIDTVGAAPAMNTAKTLGESASSPLPQDGAVSLFRRTLAEQTAENAALGETVRAAMVCVSETLDLVDAALPAPADATFSRAEGSDPQVASGEIAVKADVSVPLTSGETSHPQVEKESVVQVASGEIAVKADVSVPLTSGETSHPQVEKESVVQVASGESTVKADVSVPLTSGETSLPLSSEELPDEIDIPEPSADALVAAGVAASAVARSTEVAASQPTTVVAPVDVVRVQTAEALAPAAVLVQAAEAVADTLLVTPGLLRGQGEVIVQLRPDVLDGTEVKIAVTGRQLEVVFQPQTVNMAVLIENCRAQLVQHLAAKIVSFNVSVDVRKKRG